MRLRKIAFIAICFVLLALIVPYRYNALSAESSLETHKKDIIEISHKTGVWASVTAAQFILEGGNPVSDLALEDNNYFGIKWSDKYTERYPGAYEVKYMTKEANEDGELVPQPAWFTHFPSVRDSIVEHSVIWWNGYYEDELNVLYNLNSSRDEFVNTVGKGAYATDPKYTYKLKKCIAEYNLDELDKIAFPNGRKYCGNESKVEGTYNYPDDGYNSSEIIEIAKTYSEKGVDMLIVDSQEPLPESFSGINPDEIESSTSENKIIKKLRLFIEDELHMSLTVFFNKMSLTLGIILFILALMILVLSGFDLVTDGDLLSRFSLNMVKRDSGIVVRLLLFITLLILGMCFMVTSYLVDN